MPDTDLYDVQENLIRALTRRQLLEYNADRSSYELHPMVQEKAYRSLSKDSDRLLRAHTLAYTYFLAVPLIRESDWRTTEDIKPRLMAHYHASQAEAWDQAAEAIEDFGQTCLYQWSEFRLILNLYGNLLPSNWREGYRKLSSYQVHGLVLMIVGLAYYNLGTNQLATEYHQRAIDIANQLDDPIMTGKAMSNLGLAYHSLGDYQTSIRYYYQALPNIRNSQDRHMEGKVLNNLGYAYHYMGDFDVAIDYHQQRLAIATEIGDRLGQANGLDNWGRTLRELGNYVEALDKLDQAIDIFRNIGDRRGEAEVLKELAETSFRQGHLELGSSRCAQALNLAQDLEFSALVQSCDELQSKYSPA